MCVVIVLPLLYTQPYVSGCFWADDEALRKPLWFCFQANVSQTEYERAHREYLKQVQLSQDGQRSRTRRDLHVFQTAGKVTSTFAKIVRLEVGSPRPGFFAQANEYPEIITLTRQNIFIPDKFALTVYFVLSRISIALFAAEQLP